jgi:tetraacyldisaccharide 4'-kinase
LVLLDDGFQHWRIARDRDFVLVDAVEDIGQIFPFGKFRESAAALRRADAVFLSRASKVEAPVLRSLEDRVRNVLEKRHAPIWKKGGETKPLILPLDYEFDSFLDLRGQAPAGNADAAEFLLVSGIAKPDRFRELARAQGLAIREEIYFPDHHRLTDANHRQIRQSVRALKNGRLLMSEKDWARWHTSLTDLQGLVLKIRFRFFGDGESQFNAFLTHMKGEIRRCSISDSSSSS